MNRNLLFPVLPIMAWLIVAFLLPVSAQVPPVNVGKAGSFYVDPESGNKVWRVTDESLCPRGGKHYYSYWPVWNADGSHLIVECVGWSRASSNAILLRDTDLKVLGDALAGAPNLVNGRLFWSWTDRNVFYGYKGSEIWQWNPFTHKGQRLYRFEGFTVGEMGAHTARLAYISFDDRYALVEMQGPNRKKQKSSPWDTLALVTLDLKEKSVVGVLDLTDFKFYDEAVFTRDNHVWVRVNDQGAPQSLRYNLDFSARTRVAEGGHHAHGLLPNGKAVSIKAGSNRDCPPGSPSGNPHDKEYPAKGWKPTAVLLDDSVDSPAEKRSGPLASLLWKLGCQIPGQHHFAHFSWNNTQKDQFFVDTASYSGYETDSLAYSILRVRLQFDAAGAVTGEQIEVLARHRSQSKQNYWAQPRVNCNQQGTRCLFASTMSVNTDLPRPQPHLYIVDVPQQ